MTLAEFAHLVGVDRKWVLNALSALDLPATYSLALARRLAVTRAIHEATGMSLSRSFALAERGLRAHARNDALVVLPTDDDSVNVTLDIHRLLSSFSVRLSVLRTTFAPRQRGRPAGGRDPLQVAANWGIDLTLIAHNFTKTAAERVRQLDAMAAFARGVRRPFPSVR